jgi:predicted metal-binding membrane protein
MLMVVARAGAPGARPARGVGGGTMLFAIGYLLVWTAFSGLAALAQWGLRAAALLSPAMHVTPQLAGATLVVAGLYQLTPAKGACLTHCRSPIDFLMSHWRGGARGSLRMGAHHGLYCLGCCWALMAVLFAVGVMNLIWVAVIAIFVLIEKTGPAARVVSRAAGLGLIAFGLTTIFLH